VQDTISKVVILQQVSFTDLILYLLISKSDDQLDLKQLNAFSKFQNISQIEIR